MSDPSFILEATQENLLEEKGAANFKRREKIKMMRRKKMVADKKLSPHFLFYIQNKTDITYRLQKVMRKLFLNNLY